jgi:hypothetical protein
MLRLEPTARNVSTERQERRPEPCRIKDRADKAELTHAKLKSDRSDPLREKRRSDSEEPAWKYSISEWLPCMSCAAMPKRAPQRALRPCTSRSIERKLTALPTCKKRKTDAEDPQRAKQRIDTEDPRLQLSYMLICLCRALPEITESPEPAHSTPRSDTDDPKEKQSSTENPRIV